MRRRADTQSPAGGHAASVFISYSRRDYYFAESLTFHLCGRDVQAWMDVKELTPGAHWEQALFDAIDRCAVFVLVASPAALASPHVRTEWQRAQAAGKRIVLLGWDRRVDLPPELQACEWLDFRGRFASALRGLVVALSSDERCASAGVRPGRGPWLPPAVIGMLLALVVPIVGYGLAVAGDFSRNDFEDLGYGLGRGAGMALFTVFTVASVWGLCLSLVQRRMGMTRLLGCLAFVAAPFVLSAWKVARHGADGLVGTPPLVAQVVLQYLPFAWALAAIPIAAMAVLWWLRPEDLLRWMPTGKAWSRYRVAFAEQVSVSAPDAARAITGIGRFQLLHDAADQPLAEHLRAELLRAGSTAATADDTDATSVVLLSNHSTRDWLERDVQPRSAAALLTVVGSAISLAPALDWLWRRQWIDLRRWALHRPPAEQGLPGLPESVTTLRMPPQVTRVHALLCAFVATLAVSLVYVEPVNPRADDDVSVAQIGVVLSLLLAVWAARQLARRGAPKARLRRWLCMALVGGVVSTVLAGLTPNLSSDAQWVAWISMSISAALAAWIWSAVPSAEFWLPAPLATQPPAAQRLIPKADSRTLVTVLAFVALWGLLVQTVAPGLLER